MHGRPITLAFIFLALGCGSKETNRTKDAESSPPPDSDVDDDGYSQDVDCNDNDASIHPGADELCNEVDDDCDDEIDEDAVDMEVWYDDWDNDGFGDPDMLYSTTACSMPEGYVADSSDCDDEDSRINPEAEEVCGDHVDNNCNDSHDGCRPEGNYSWSTATLSSPFGARAAGDINGDGMDDFFGTQISDDEVYSSLIFSGESTGELDESDAFAAITGGTSLRGIQGSTDMNDDGQSDLLLITVTTGWSGDTPTMRFLYGPITEDTGLVYGDLQFTHSGSYCGYGSADGDLNGDDIPDILIRCGNDLYIKDSPHDDSSSHNLNYGSSATIEAADYPSFGSGTDYSGDADGDGFDDLLVSAPSLRHGTSEGKGFIFLGPIEGDLTPDDYRGIFYSSWDGKMSTNLIFAGDVDNDGRDDVLCTEPIHNKYQSMENRKGRAYLFEDPGNLGGGPDDATVVSEGDRGGDHAPSNVSRAGDVDGNGVEDLLFGVYNRNISYLIYGPFEGSYSLGDADLTISNVGPIVGSLGDINDDGFGDFTVSGDIFFGGGW